MLMTQVAYAKTIGKSKQYVGQLVEKGVIVLKNKKVSKSQADAAISEMRDPSRDAQREANEKRKRESLLDEANLPEHSLADMTAEERDEYDKRLLEERRELDLARERAKAAGADVGSEKMPTSLTKVKIFRELYMGKIAQLDFRAKNGEMLNKADVESDAYESARIVRDQFIGMAVRISTSLSRVNNVAEIEKILEDEIMKILENISA